jgi:transcription initiation factor TFIID subunit TAF12
LFFSEPELRLSSPPPPSYESVVQQQQPQEQQQQQQHDQQQQHQLNNLTIPVFEFSNCSTPTNCNANEGINMLLLGHFEVKVQS